MGVVTHLLWPSHYITMYVFAGCFKKWIQKKRYSWQDYLLRVLSFQETWYWPGQVSADAVVMSGVRCSGTEMSLSHCLHHGEHISCAKGGGRHAAGVSCSESRTFMMFGNTIKYIWNIVRFKMSLFLFCSCSWPGLEPSGGPGDHLHGGPTHVHASVCVWGELSGLYLQSGSCQLVPPPPAVLLPNPQQRTVGF